MPTEQITNKSIESNLLSAVKEFHCNNFYFNLSAIYNLSVGLNNDAISSRCPFDEALVNRTRSDFYFKKRLILNNITELLF